MLTKSCVRTDRVALTVLCKYVIMKTPGMQCGIFGEKNWKDFVLLLVLRRCSGGTCEDVLDRIKGSPTLSVTGKKLFCECARNGKSPV